MLRYAAMPLCVVLWCAVLVCCYVPLVVLRLLCEIVLDCDDVVVLYWIVVLCLLCLLCLWLFGSKNSLLYLNQNEPKKETKNAQNIQRFLEFPHLLRYRYSSGSRLSIPTINFILYDFIT